MNFQIAVLLGQDGITNGAIYALLAMSILLVFTVTRVLLIPLGEFVTYGALTMAMIQANNTPMTVWLLVTFTVITCVMELYTMKSQGFNPKALPFMVVKLSYAGLMLLGAYTLPLANMPMFIQGVLTLGLIVPLGPMIYRVCFQPLASAPSLVLLIVSIALHVAMVGVGLLMFGPEGARTEPFSSSVFRLGNIMLKSQTLWVIAASLCLIVMLFIAFDRTLYGKALKATAINRTGARLIGISPDFAGKATFGLATFIGVASGILIAPITTLYYDSGFVISLKGFVGAIIGGLVSYPLAAFGSIAVGLVEALSMFWASNYKEIIVFMLIIPFLVWRSMHGQQLEENDG
ncbi:branched-chain amino acid ABC transporter permease [Vibrio nitrifigilis]|uniref:Branched-chain amino acid ABC transporter permease n=1 Tax=Vibrio nitrifigilis TaxID=2789781 RepID=A0ABS0G9G3_9VIBR|nr:branched-chain amino acid ABC transporter permease [Vibrio nitrifigilis]MBF8999047.1 branched-chain amino acid ABC transporter permease [Vibrio nitrifigilis]